MWWDLSSLYCKLAAGCASKRILEIGQYWMHRWEIPGGFLDHPVHSYEFDWDSTLSSISWFRPWMTSNDLENTVERQNVQDVLIAVLVLKLDRSASAWSTNGSIDWVLIDTRKRETGAVMHRIPVSIKHRGQCGYLNRVPKSRSHPNKVWQWRPQTVTTKDILVKFCPTMSWIWQFLKSTPLDFHVFIVVAVLV